MIETELEQLWNEHQFRIANFIGKRMQRQWGQDTINDLVSSVFLRAAVAINNGNGPVEHAGAWLYQIARSVIADHFRALQYKSFQDFDECWMEPCRDASPHELAEQAILQAQVQRAISRLTASQEDVINLRLEGYNYNEISEVMHMSLDGAKQLNVRAFRNLREWLKDVA